MQSPMPLTTGASTALLSALSVIASPPLATTICSTSLAGFWKRIANPQAQGPCALAKSAANESGSSLTRKLTPPWRYTVIGRDLVVQDGAEAHLAEVVVQQRALALRRGELDELETVDAHRIFEGDDLHAEIGLGVWAGRGGLGAHGGTPANLGTGIGAHDLQPPIATDAFETAL